MISVRLLGPLEVLVDGHPVEVPGVRTRAVLARLAIEAGTIVSVDRLIDDVWGAATPANALNALQVRVSQLRSAVGRDSIRATRPGYVLAVDPHEVDALAVETAISAARRTVALDPDEAAAIFGLALARWRGPSFSGLGDAPFTLAASARWEELRLSATEEQLHLELSAGRVLDRLPDLEALAALHPLREPLHELLVRAYASLGRQADALGAYRRVRQRLVEELGIDPGRRLQELETAVLRQDPSLVGQDSDAPNRAPRQVPRVTSTSHVETVPAPSVPVSAVPASPVTGNLPRSISRILYRAADVAAVQKMLERHRLVTITGPAGVGKTTLAIELAGLAPPRTHGVWFVGLEGTLRAEQVADSIALAIGAPLDQPLASLRSRLRGADTLLLVDNCEHLGDGPAALFRELLEHCPNLTVLATSQRPLGVRGEAIWPLEPLSRAEALELFSSRVSELNPRIVFDQETLRSADAVCATLDDLPLAIELAARRCGVLGVEEVAERLRDRFELLSDHASDRPERHQTLAKAIGWSYDLLFPDTQLLLQIIAAFPDGATLDAVEYVGPIVGVPRDEVLDLLTQLVNRSLVVTDRSRNVIRFRVLNSIRAFATVRAEAADRTEAIRAAHAGWVTRLAKRCALGLRTPDQAGWLATVREERLTINTAFDWLVINDPEASLNLANDLYLGWLIIGDNLAAAARLGRALHAAVDAPLPLRVRVAASQAVTLSRIGRHEEAAPLAGWALANVDVGTPLAVALTRSIVGQVYSLAGRIDDGLALMGQARPMLAASGDTWAQAICTLNIALAHGRLGDYLAQERLTGEALGLLRPHNDPFVRRLAYRNLALVQLRIGGYAAALDSLEEALEAERSIGFIAEEAGTLRLMARAYRLLGDGALAVDALLRSIRTSRLLGDAFSTDLAVADLMALRRADGDVAGARDLLDHHHSNASVNDSERLPPALQIQIGALSIQSGDGSGTGTVERALALAVEQNDTHQQILALDVLARIGPGPTDTGHRFAEADRLAAQVGLHPTERPDRLADRIARDNQSSD